jgi:ATP-dependent DNA helicase DinG
MDAVFGPGGRLAEVLAGFEPRPEQACLARAVEAALTSGRHLVAEAGTGTGKSLAYLIPALASGERVVVATATKALQAQLLDQDVPAAAAALDRDVRVAVLKGRQNYVCRKALYGIGLLGGELFSRQDDRQAFEAMDAWLEGTETGDRAELPFEPPERVWSELAVGPDRCTGRRCPFVATCFSERAREDAAEAELVIVNHALYFADLAVRGGRRPARPRRGRVRRGAPARGGGGSVARCPGQRRAAPATPP